MNKQTADDLRAARNQIATPDKWCKSRFGTPETAQCARGALMSVCGIIGARHDSAEAAIQRAIGTRFIAEWNDAPERTHAEVLAAFDRAIATQEAA